MLKRGPTRFRNAAICSRVTLAVGQYRFTPQPDDAAPAMC